MAGIIVMKGIAIGRCQPVREIQYKIRENLISQDCVQNELDLFEASKAKALTQIDGLRKHALENVGEEESAIFEAHIMMLEDPMYLDSVRSKITNYLFAAEKAVMAAREDLTAMFSQIDNEYIRERAKDIEDVSNRLLDIILDVDSNPLEHITSATVIVAKDLKPSQMVLLNENVKGIILETGSVTSHAAIVAKAKGIPTIIGETGICEKVNIDDLVILDAREYKVLINPDPATLDQYRQWEIREEKEKEALKVLKDLD